MHINQGEVLALIPARKGSQGIIDKNILELEGFPLLAYSVAAAKLCGQIDRIFVSTNSEQYGEIAKKYGAEVPFLRPDVISRDSSTDFEYIEHALLSLEKMEGAISEYVVILRPTTPVRKTSSVSRAIQLMKRGADYTAVVSVSKTKECPYKWMKIGEDGFLESLISEMEPDDVNLPRQSFPPVWIPDGYVDVAKSEAVLRTGCVYGKKAWPLVIEENAVDIDTVADVKALSKEMVCESEVFQYLRSHNFAEV